MGVIARGAVERSSRVRRYGVAAAAAGSALALVMGSPVPAAASAPPAVALTATYGFQPAIDALVAEMQRLVDLNMTLPYATPGSEDNVMLMLQNTNYQLLSAGLSRVTQLFNGVFFQAPEVIAGNATEPRQYFDFFTPDIYYRVTAGLAPGATYVLHGTLGGGTEHFAISTQAITGGTAQAIEDLELGDGLVLNPDGTFTVYIGPEAPAGALNFMDTTDATVGGAASLLIRDILGDWAKGPGSVTVQCVADCPPFFAIPEGGFFPSDNPVSTTLADSGGLGSVDSILTTLFSAFAQVVGPFNTRAIEGGASVGMNIPANTMHDLGPQTSYGAGLASAVVTGGNFDLNSDEALVIKVPNVESTYSGIQLMNVYGGALPYVMAQSTLNHTTTYHDPDGYTYYVVSGSNPGVANWLDTGGLERGEIFARFEHVADPDSVLGLGVSAQVVSLSELGDYLPSGTPTVSPEEFAADMAQRVLSYGYALDMSRMTAQPDWVLQNLLMNGLQGLMGNENYEAVFASQPFTPMELRFTEALSPDWDAVMRSVLDNPMESLSAVWNALPLLASNISLPITLGLAQTALSVVMPQLFIPTINDLLFDPNTSILAGLLNARDNLATVILTANDDWPTELSERAAQQWANMADLIATTPSFDLNDWFGG
ncbi:hypothetical protein [Mycolicibacter arupensis]|uniref:DUF1214 domain-containing protein n=1 Tax=Mycolicibacter arupensis TaxID=342002 RepID=A0A0F5N229_9MYCO|nr:hypothetical protein [Mycolicibacter arupensis]KKC00925.1 hypothetical protein WR43_02905 [Mycolicibacter arupensis]MCV7274500.1 hypothetical protein [Mycolicibacter arupensis]OQZ99396.1 hypothetical protein BST15_07755 [Mycolicibacter arupensis]